MRYGMTRIEALREEAKIACCGGRASASSLLYTREQLTFILEHAHQEFLRIHTELTCDVAQTPGSIWATVTNNVRSVGQGKLPLASSIQ
jgi:hypothetical protein